MILRQASRSDDERLINTLRFPLFANATNIDIFSLPLCRRTYENLRGSIEELLARGTRLHLLPLSRGFAPWSRRFFDSVALGCIPVVIADNIELPFEEFIDYRKFTVKVMESDIVNLKDILLSIPKERILEMFRELRKIGSTLRTSNHTR